MTAAASAEVVELTKRCTKCGETKPISSFYIARRETDGRTFWCKNCTKVQRQQFHAANPTARGEKHMRAVAKYDERAAAAKQIGLRVCCDCKQAKPFSDFPKFRGVTIGVGSRCRRCNSQAALKWRRENRDRDRANGKATYVARKYGLSLDAFQILMDVQHGKCAICRVEFGSSLNTCVDHCHEAGTVRGLLCRSCNVGLGGFKDNVASMEAAIHYLKKSRGEA